MGIRMNVKIIERMNIKPSSPTPNHLQTLQFSYFDQIAPAIYTNVILFYTNDSSNGNAEICRRLKVSLSDTLTLFYPLAGRIKGNKLIDCSDQGAVFVEARVNCCLVDVLREPDTDVLNLFHPDKGSNSSAESQLLMIQANFFKCGGIALSVNMSHKLVDMSSLSSFIRAWTAAATGLNQQVIPQFNASSLFPPVDFSFTCPNQKEKFIRKRFVFDAPKIALLKDKIASGGNIKPTRVEAISALIWKTVTAASGSSMSCWSHVVNMRKRIVPPLSEYLVGNIGTFYLVKNENNEEMEVMVEKLRKGIEMFDENEYVKRFQGDDGFSVYCQTYSETGEMVQRLDRNFYMCSSWCRFGLYERDFGWGRPKWVTTTTVPYINSSILLMDTQNGDGIEAWVVLRERDMISFEKDKRLLSFATPNPSVIV